MPRSLFLLLAWAGSAAFLAVAVIEWRLGGIYHTVLALGLAALTFFTAPASSADFTVFFIVLLGIFLGAGIGNASVFKQIVMIFEPKQASPVLGFTAAMAVLLLGFFVPLIFGRSFAATGGPNAALWSFVGFYVLCAWLNYWYYWRKGAEKPC